MSLPFRHRTTKKESRRSPWPTVAALEERIEEIMDRVEKAGDNHVERVAALELPGQAQQQLCHRHRIRRGHPPRPATTHGDAGRGGAGHR
jgi:ABC-type phosphate/phosphonate transport system permease subunit